MKPILRPTPGITIKQFTKDPLGTEGELTPGPDDVNPFNSAEEKQIVDEIKESRSQQQDQDLVKIPLDERIDPLSFDIQDGPQF